MKVLITGSSGSIGSYLFEKLSRDHRLFGLDLRQGPYTNVVGDVQDFGLVEGLVSRVDIVIHCAAQTSVVKSVEDALFDAKNNVIGTLNLLEAARRSRGLRRFIYFSSAAVYGFPEYVPIDECHPCRPVSPYGVSKLAGEFYAKVFHELYGVPTVCVRPFNVYGGRQGLNSPYSGVISKFLYRIDRGLPPVIYGDGSQSRDFVHVQDVADMIVLALGCDEAVGAAFNCGTGKEVSIEELARLMISLSGKGLKPKYSEGKRGDINRSCADIKKAEKMLGFKPKISVEQWLMELFNYSSKLKIADGTAIRFNFRS